MVSRGCAIAVLLLGLPSQTHAAPLRVALAPVERVNVAVAEGERLLQMLRQVLTQAHGVEPAGAATVSCELREADCLGRLARELGSQRLAVLRVGRLGETTVIRLTVYDLQRRVRQGSWQEVLRRGVDRSDERQALQRMVAGFAPPAPPPPPPWYSRWWVWTVVGAAVAGGVTAAVLLTRDGGREPDEIIVPP